MSTKCVFLLGFCLGCIVDPIHSLPTPVGAGMGALVVVQILLLCQEGVLYWSSVIIMNFKKKYIYTFQSTKEELPSLTWIGHPSAPRGEEFQPLGSLVFAETILHLSAHLRE